MNLNIRRVFLFLCCMIMLSAENGFGEQSVKNPFLANSEMNLYFKDDSICGVISIYYLLAEIGHKVSINDIVSDVQVSFKGNSADDMCRFLKKQNVGYLAVKTESLASVLKPLESSQRAAILHTDKGKHFVMVKSVGDNKWIALDGKEIIDIDSTQDLAGRYSGFAIIAGKNVLFEFYRSLLIKNMPLFAGLLICGFISGRLASRLFKKMR